MPLGVGDAGRGSRNAGTTPKNIEITQIRRLSLKSRGSYCTSGLFDRSRLLVELQDGVFIMTPPANLTLLPELRKLRNHKAAGFSHYYCGLRDGAAPFSYPIVMELEHTNIVRRPPRGKGGPYVGRGVTYEELSHA